MYHIIMYVLINLNHIVSYIYKQHTSFGKVTAKLYRCIALHVLKTSKGFWIFSVPSIMVKQTKLNFGNTCLLERVQKVLVFDL